MGDRTQQRALRQSGDLLPRQRLGAADFEAVERNQSKTDKSEGDEKHAN